ncbi:Protein kinase superfamily protein [Raphanus sativus]|nr:Protein kinase superfamily protein [Raphanus sativus]
MFHHLSRTKIYVGQRGSLEDQQRQSVKRLPATWTNTANNKSFNSYAANAPFGASQAQWKLEMPKKINKETAWNNKPAESYHVRDAKYIPPPGRKSPSKFLIICLRKSNDATSLASMNKNWVFPRGPSEAAYKTGRCSGRRRKMESKATETDDEGWMGGRKWCNMFLRPTQPPNPYSRRIAG